ncbi:unnamed protein product [Miscanthus lutarioriparius]|uniref:Plant heme peroxidase family profile domain-containing protein n=1 Tax=Miscanthus lutarioriparius TaxID=422564 RepID=A0A811RTJ7_9POAL|nr:unnamed protein product [Miscanthus lutarioriparius]
MAMATSACQALAIIVITAAAPSTASAEEAVRNATQRIINNDPTMGAAFVRLFFHDCFVKVND